MASQQNGDFDSVQYANKLESILQTRSEMDAKLRAQLDELRKIIASEESAEAELESLLNQ